MNPLTASLFSDDYFAQYALDHNQTPICQRTHDAYYMRQNGLEERQFIYLESRKLFDRFMESEKAIFTIGEIGFGTGLSFISTLRLWKEKNSKNKTLLYISTEQYPFKPSDLCHVLEPWKKELNEEIEDLKKSYHILSPGLNIIPFLKHRVVLIILVGPAEITLDLCDFKADHWYYDGFSPSKNPSAWSDKLITEVTRLSRDQTSLASFSASSVFRKTLESKGWVVQRAEGFRYKKHCTRALLKEASHEIHKPIFKSLSIIGGGIAGWSVAFFRSWLGSKSTLYHENRLTASQAPEIYTIPKIHRRFDNTSSFNLKSHFFASVFYDQLRENQGVLLQKGYEEHFEIANRTHRFFHELYQNQSDLWKSLIVLSDENRIFYPNAIVGSGADILHFLKESSTQTEYIEETYTNWTSCNSVVLACSWGAQCWGELYNPSSILRGEMSPNDEKWSKSTHERYRYNPNPSNPQGFVGFRTTRVDYIPLILKRPLYCSLHHGSRGFSSGPLAGLQIALSSLGLFEYNFQ